MCSSSERSLPSSSRCWRLNSVIEQTKVTVAIRSLPWAAAGDEHPIARLKECSETLQNSVKRPRPALHRDRQLYARVQQ
jgi:hypothetical protein